jgi:hypothetical protein
MNDMKINGMPEQFWVVTRPSKVSQLCDICFACTFERLLLQGRGGLHENEIMGIYADEDEAEEEAMRLLGEYPVRPQDSAFFEVVVNVMVQPKVEELTARELGKAAVDAVRSAIQLAEERGHQHRLGDRVALGVSEVTALRNQIVVYG